MILALALALGCVTFSAADGETQAAPADFYVYVGLLYGSSAVEEAKFSCSDGFIIASHSRSGYAEVQDLRYYTSLVAKAEGANINLYDPDGNEVYAGLGNSTALMSANADHANRFINLNDSTYREGFVFGSYGDGTMAIANYTTLEHYLWGVLQSEMGSDKPLEALKAQAVAARSFAMAHLGYHGGGALGFDVCSGTHCQVFSGVRGERNKTTQACQETAGKVLGYDGEVVAAFYHAFNFGYTLDADEYWGGSNPYCKSVRDPYGSDHNWATDFSFEEIETRLNRNGKGVGTLKSVAVIARYDNGAVKTLEFKGEDGSVSTVSGSKIISVFNLKSLGFSMSGNPDPVINRGASGGMYAKSKTTSDAVNNTICVMGASGEAQNINISAIQIFNGTTTVSAPFHITDLPEFTDALVNTGHLYLKGLGFGHCVGMNQSGAENMARAGYDYEYILHYYYTDVEVCNFTALKY